MQQQTQVSRSAAGKTTVNVRLVDTTLDLEVSYAYQSGSANSTDALKVARRQAESLMKQARKELTRGTND